MAEFVKQDLSGARFEQVDFSGARFRNVYFVDVLLRGAVFENVEIDGDVKNLTINGVDVAPLIEAELNRRYPRPAQAGPRRRRRLPGGVGDHRAFVTTHHRACPTAARGAAARTRRG